MFEIIMILGYISSLTTASRSMTDQSERDHWYSMRNKMLAEEIPESGLKNLFLFLNFTTKSEEFQSYKTYLINFDTDSKLLNKISKFFAERSIVSYQIELETYFNSEKNNGNADVNWIILVGNIHKFYSLVRWSKTFWNPSNKYIVLVLDREYLNLGYQNEILSILWRRNRISKILIGSIQDQFKFFERYSPFKIISGDYGMIQTVMIDEENNEITTKNHGERIINQDIRSSINYENNYRLEAENNETLSLRKMGKIFEDFENLNQYPIKVTIFLSAMMQIPDGEDGSNSSALSGLDAETMKLLEKSMNANFQIKVLPYGIKRDPFEEGLSEIDSGETELLMTTYFIKLYENHESYYFTVSIYVDKVCLIGRSAGRVPKSFMPFLPFNPNLWPILILYNISISALWLWFKHYSDRIHHEKEFMKEEQQLQQHFRQSEKKNKVDPPEIDKRIIACLDITILTCSHLEDAETTAQRLFVAGTLCFTIVILGLYESTLISSLSKPFRYQELHTLKDVDKSNFSIVTKYHNLKTSTFHDSSLEEKVKIVQNTELTTRSLISRKSKVLGIVRLLSFELEDGTEFFDEDGFSKLHMVEECPASYSTSYVVKRFSPYLTRINSLLLRMGQAGLFVKWYNDMRFPIYRAEQKKSVENSSERKKLSLVHYSIIFSLHLVALMACILIFIMEIKFAKRIRDKENQNK